MKPEGKDAKGNDVYLIPVTRTLGTMCEKCVFSGTNGPSMTCGRTPDLLSCLGPEGTSIYVHKLAAATYRLKGHL